MPAQGLLLPEVDPTTIAVPPSGSVSLVVNLTGQLTVIKPDGSINPINPVNQLSAPVTVNSSAAGNTTVGPGIGILPVIVNVTGLASVRTISLSIVGLTSADAGKLALVLFLFPGPLIAGVGLQVFNANTSGALLFNTDTDGVQQSAFGWFYFDGAAWQKLLSEIPALNA
jgi:hypothetical protein